jgi:UDP-glucose 4-epimerase
MSAHILVTGGTGTLGSMPCQDMLAASHRATVVDRPMYGQRSLFHFCTDPNFDFILVDVRDTKGIPPSL